MNLADIRDTYLCLTFNEANIVLENIGKMDKNALIIRVKELKDNTEDKTLRADANNLLWKLTQMTQADYDRLLESVQDGSLMFPGNYRLTYP